MVAEIISSRGTSIKGDAVLEANLMYCTLAMDCIAGKRGKLRRHVGWVVAI